jgi:hypothetical protein
MAWPTWVPNELTEETFATRGVIHVGRSGAPVERSVEYRGRSGPEPATTPTHLHWRQQPAGGCIMWIMRGEPGASAQPTPSESAGPPRAARWRRRLGPLFWLFATEHALGEWSDRRFGEKGLLQVLLAKLVRRRGTAAHDGGTQPPGEG